MEMLFFVPITFIGFFVIAAVVLDEQMKRRNVPVRNK
jgi:hypothetical protein